MEGSSATQRLAELVDEHEEPWKEKEALQITLNELDRDQSVAGQLLGCSGSNISYWKDKLNVGAEEVVQEHTGGEVCRRCGVNETPDNAGNDMCNPCLDYVRFSESDRGLDGLEFAEHVVDGGNNE